VDDDDDDNDDDDDDDDDAAEPECGIQKGPIYQLTICDIGKSPTEKRTKTTHDEDDGNDVDDGDDGDGDDGDNDYDNSDNDDNVANDDKDADDDKDDNDYVNDSGIQVGVNTVPRWPGHPTGAQKYIRVRFRVRGWGDAQLRRWVAVTSEKCDASVTR